MSGLEKSSQIYRDTCFPTRTYRSFEAHAQMFGYEGKEHLLRGKKILEIGAGDSDFAEGAREHGAFVVQLDPTYSAEHPLFNKPAFHVLPVAAVVQELPFKDEMFDEVIASYSLWWTRTNTDQAIMEMLRVTRPNGMVKVTPVFFNEALVAKLDTNPAITFYGNKFNEALFIQKTNGAAHDKTFTQLDALTSVVTGRRERVNGRDVPLSTEEVILHTD